MKASLTLSKALVFLSLLVFGQSAVASWTTCYNKHERRLYFSPYKSLNSSYVAPKVCSGTVFFQADQPETLIEDSFDRKGYPKGDAGTPKIINVSRSKKIIATQWNSFGQINTLRILAPDFKNKKVRVVCEAHNWGEAYSIKHYAKSKKLSLLVRTPMNDEQTRFAIKSIPCSL